MREYPLKSVYEYLKRGGRNVKIKEEEIYLGIAGESSVIVLKERIGFFPWQSKELAREISADGQRIAFDTRDSQLVKAVDQARLKFPELMASDYGLKQ